MLLWASSVSAQ
uniref:Uncharacterized protein n=2 Tax=cellular organisms TaxID=131567 RepID=A0A0A9MTY0_ARUDO